MLNSSGDPKSALELIESRAKADPKGKFRRLLVDVLREQRQFEKAERRLRELTQESPDDENLSAALVQVLSQEAAEAAAAGDADRQRSLDEKARAAIEADRKRFPNSLIFLQAECDLAARGANYARAIAVTQEIDKIAPHSTMGPVLRARLFARQEKPREVVKAYTEALERSPGQHDNRVLLGQELLKLREFDEALEQARIVLETSKDRYDAMLLEARALAETGITDAQKTTARQAAVDRLEMVITAAPRFAEAYHVLAEIELAQGRRPEAIAALQRDLKANPQDPVAIARLIQMLAAREPGKPAPPAGDLEQARRLASELTTTDKQGSLVLAAGVGFHKAGQLDLALPLAQAATRQLDTPVAHLNLGDLLLSMAEGQPDQSRARALFEQAIQEYDRVLKVQPSQVEAVNNKAWVMHAYLGRSDEAMALMQGLLQRVNAEVLPGEFYDTLGAVNEALGRRGDAEKSYLKGLDKTPDHPVLNYHFGKLLSADRNRTTRAKGYLAKALASRDQLSPAMASDAEGLVKQLSRSISGN